MVLLILGAVWAAVLIPPALRARAEASPGDSIGSFHHGLNVLRRTGGYTIRPGFGEHGPVPAPSASPVPQVRYSLAKKRRRDILVSLLWIMGGTLALGLLPAFRALLILHLVADALFAAYVVLLLRMKKATEEERAKVTRLPRRAPAEVADLAIRRASGS